METRTDLAREQSLGLPCWGPRSVLFSSSDDHGIFWELFSVMTLGVPKEQEW